MLSESRLVYLIIYVKDLAVSRVFYEKFLGFSVLEEDDSAVKYDAGHVVLCLNRAADYGITLPTSRDRSADITFLVEDLDGMRAALEQRGVKFSRTIRYEAGATADFYDPDEHWFSLYEPSKEALTWPSGEKIRAFWKANGQGQGDLWASSTSLKSSNGSSEDFRLDGKDLIYLFLFVHDPKGTFTFYRDVLGLHHIEAGPCKRGEAMGGTMESDGVIKYDAGGTLLTTHHVDARAAESHRVNPAGMKGVALVFHVTDIQRMFDELLSKGVRFNYGPAASEIGTQAQFEDPSGHLFYLYEPSAEALASPSGAKLKQILAAPL